VEVKAHTGGGGTQAAGRSRRVVPVIGSEQSCGRHWWSCRGSDVGLVVFIIDAVLNHLLELIRFGIDDHTRREEEVEVAPVVVLELTPAILC
jgi:hypothetical protein